jgi:predicted lipoprotein with Yx(FWY)xxD motif
VKRIFAVLATATATTLAIAGTAAAGGSPNVKLANTNAGKLLEAKSGLVLFMFSKDSKNKDTCQNISTCPSAWAADTAKPTGGPGVNKQLLGTIKLKNGKHQITYNGHPLYTFVGDTPGDTSYLGQFAQGGHWYGVSAAGKKVG